MIRKTDKTCGGKSVFRLTTPYGQYDIVFRRGSYAQGELAIRIDNLDYEEDPPQLEPYSVLTVNLDPYTEMNDQGPLTAFLDTNNNPEAEVIMQRTGLATPTGVTRRSGYCEYPLYRFDEKKLEELTLAL